MTRFLFRIQKEMENFQLVLAEKRICEDGNE